MDTPPALPTVLMTYLPPTSEMTDVGVERLWIHEPVKVCSRFGNNLSVLGQIHLI